MNAHWIGIVMRVLRSVVCLLVAALLVWRGWSMEDPQGTESVLCCLAAMTLMMTGIAVGTGADAEPRGEEGSGFGVQGSGRGT
jgi:hypothetical protein